MFINFVPVYMVTLFSYLIYTHYMEAHQQQLYLVNAEGVPLDMGTEKKSDQYDFCIEEAIEMREKAAVEQQQYELKYGLVARLSLKETLSE